MTKVLEIERLSVFFNNGNIQNEVVKGISFDLFKGEILGIVGESGSGKSVTVLSIMRLLDQHQSQTTGKIKYTESQTVEILSIPEKEMYHIRGKGIGMIFQEPMTSLNPVHRCGDQVAEAILWHNKVSQQEAKKKTLSLFEKVKLPEPERIWSSYPHELSGGQKQRVMIAMALSCDPQVLIADEPTTALDVTVQKSILDLLKSLQQELGLSVVFITHDLGVIGEFADRVIVMNKGEIVEQGPVGQLFQNPEHAYTKGLLACRPSLEHKLTRLLTIADFMENQNSKSIEASLEERIIPESTRQERLRFLQSQQPKLRVSNLNTWFPKRSTWLSKTQEWVKAVNDVSFEVFPGETLGLVGESGCGKTTLGRTLLRLATATSGHVWYDNTDIMAMSKAQWRSFCPKIQIIFQDPYSSLNPKMTIGQAILEPILVHHKFDNQQLALERVYELLRQVGLSPEHFNRLPHEFSGGQRQRICIARALALEPDFLICDESVSALDVSVQAQVLNLLMELREQLSFTCIFISHDLSVVNSISDRIMVMNQGKIEEIGNANDIFRQPKSEYTRKLIDAIPGRKKYSW